MKIRLLILSLIIGVVSKAQIPTGYVPFNSMANYISIKADSGLHVPRYAGTPTLRSKAWNGAGLVAVDTVNNKFYFYSGGAWREAGGGGSYTASNGITLSGSDFKLGGYLNENTIIKGNNLKTFGFDSLWSFSASAIQGSVLNTLKVGYVYNSFLEAVDLTSPNRRSRINIQLDGASLLSYNSSNVNTSYMSVSYTDSAARIYSRSGKIILSELKNSPGTKSLRYNPSTGLVSYSDTAAGLSGSGTSNYIPKFTAASTIGNSSLYNDANGRIGHGTTSPTAFTHIIQPSATGTSSGNGVAAVSPLTLTGGNGSDADADQTNKSGGNAGDLSITSGNGGAAAGTNGNGGYGGDINMTAGDGGYGATNGGQAGNVEIQGGTGGIGTNGGAAGYAALKGGSAGAAGNAAGGDVFLIGGVPQGSGREGGIFLGVSPSWTVRGNVTIGSATYGTHKLTVNSSGNGFKLADGSEGSGKVLTSDASGGATWQTPTGGVTVSSYAKNATKDSTILTLSDGTRYAVKDSVGSGGGSSYTAAEPMQITGSVISMKKATTTDSGWVSTNDQSYAGYKTFTKGVQLRNGNDYAGKVIGLWDAALGLEGMSWGYDQFSGGGQYDLVLRTSGGKTPFYVEQNTGYVYINVPSLGNAPSDQLTVSGNLNLITAGNKLKITTGSNASIGTGTLSSGTVTISTTAVTSSSLIFVQYTSCSSCGSTYIGTITNGTSFVVNSTNASDASTFNWWIIN